MSFNSIMQKTGKQIVLSLSIGEETFNRDEIIQARPYFNADLVGTVMKGCELELKRKISDQTQPIFLNVLAKYRKEAANKIYGPYYPSSETYNADKQSYTYQCYDQFVLGRFDGENYNIGLFDICSRPYQDMASYVKQCSEAMYEIADGTKVPTDEKA